MDTNVSRTQCSIACDICASTEVQEVSLEGRDGSYLRTVICRRCGLVYSDPRPLPERIRRYYQDDYRLDYKGAWEPTPMRVYRGGRAAIDRFRRLATFLKPGCRVLDIGAGSGETVYVLRAMGYEASGMEPNEGYARFASEVLAVPVAHGFYQETSIEAESQHVITMFHTLEHLESPSGALRAARTWLSPEGFLTVEVPNVEALCQWPRSRFHRAHLYNFNAAALEVLGRMTGYGVVSTSVSSDGGNVTTVFRKAPFAHAVSGEIPGNYERVCSIIRRHTSWRHVLSRHPYLRPFRKLTSRVEQWKGTKGMVAPTELLDALIASELR